MSRLFPFLLLLAAMALVSAAAKNPAAPLPWWTAASGVHEAQLAQIMGANALAHWDLAGGAAEKDGGPFTVQFDPQLNRPILVCGAKPFTLTSRTVYKEVEVTCRVRLVSTPDRRSLPYIMQIKDPAEMAKAGTQIYMVGNYDGNTTIQVGDVRATYDLRAYDTVSPIWPDFVRVPVERDMSSLPFSQHKWVTVRYRMSKTGVRVWVDDRLLLDKNDEKFRTSGLLFLSLQPGTQIAELSAKPLPAQPAGFETIPLDGYVRDRALMKNVAVADAALPFGKTVAVEGIPFAFAARNGKDAPDHIDVSRSLVREGLLQGYFPTSGPRYQGAFTVDPARIKLRIPNGRYDALYVIAAFDGEKGRAPVLSASFFRDNAGFAQVFETTVPAATATASAGAKPLPVKLENGKSANLWLVKIPLDPAMLASFSDMETLELELTKQVRQYRSYPDPFLYGWHGAGAPSGVQVYAVTLRKPEVELSLEPTVFGHVWTTPDVPSYKIAVSNRTDKAKTVALTIETTSYDKQETLKQERTVTVPAGKETPITLTFPVKRNGIHEISVTMKDGEQAWTETRNFCRLAKDTRAPVWKEGEGPLFGYWSYFGGHYTPPADDNIRIMAMAGARGVVHKPKLGEEGEKIYQKHGFREGANAWAITPQWAWAGEDPVDPQKFEAYKEEAITKLRERQGDNPEVVAFFPEPHISRELTAGNPPEYWGEKTVMTEAEKQSLRVFMNTSKSAAEAVRKAWPNTKILIPWGDPLFVVPMLRAGFPKELIDGSGLDMIGFERLPEQQIHQQSTHRLYILKEEFKKYGMENPELYYIEGTFSPTEPGALTWDEQAERYHRWSLISLAYGIERFYSGWFAFDCGSYYGAEHYGGCGIQRRIPYADPKPAYAHYATMTRMLERAKFDKWLTTGSHTVYCLQFTKPGVGPIYALWTVRGTRPVTLALEKDATVTVTDSMDNDTVVKSANGAATISVGTSPIYVTNTGAVKSVSLGKPDHTDAIEWSRNRNQETWHSGPATRKPPVTREITIANLGDGSWSLAAERDMLYENNNYDTKRFLGKMSARITNDPDRQGNFLAVRLEKQEKERQLMPWYTVLKPKKAVEIPGKAAALGMWVKANSDWGRVVYVATDAKGERWMSVGAKDDWNCNDVHGWSMFNFDGWRYLRFELPANSEYDAFREYGSTWWGHTGGDGIVDLPLKLEKVIVERRTHVIYVNDVQPANPADVLLGELIAEYETPFDATREAIAFNQVRMPLPKGASNLDNPIARMTQENPLPGARLEKLVMPDWGYDGTNGHVHFTEVPGADVYNVWLSAYPDGRGAVKLPWALRKSGDKTYGLRPAMKLYLWITYTTKAEKDKPAQTSKPSNRLEIELIDAFGQK